MHLASRVWIDAGIVHAGRSGQRRGREYLHLLRTQVQLPLGESLEFPHVGFRASRMGGDEIICEKLSFAESPAGGVKPAFELQHILHAGLPHALEHMRHDMLRRKLELSGDMVLRDR